MPALAPSLTDTNISAQHQVLLSPATAQCSGGQGGRAQAPTRPRRMQVHRAASFSQLLSCGAPAGARGFVSNQTLTGTPGSWLVLPPPHPRNRHQRTAMLLPWGHSRQSEPLAFLPGTSPGCKGSAESGSAGGAPSSGGVEGGGERGEKQETVREAPVSRWSLAAAPSRAVHRAPTARGSPAALGQAGKGQSRVPSSARHRPRCAKRLEHSQSPGCPGWLGREAHP